MPHNLDSDGLRKAFTGFFVERGHTYVPSASLIPVDPTVMFTIAGMVPFKGYFTGDEVAPFKRATSVQRCLRTPDIDIVGTTARHLTFFEMLGNFSFGDYFKPAAVGFACEVVTEVLGLEPEKLWVTVHHDDEDATGIWKDLTSIPEERIQAMGEDNFWKMGDTGPCGPCSEIYYDKGPQFGADGGPATGGPDRYVEIWNLVFMQFDRHEGGEMVPLAKPSIDTGAGLERILPILQGKSSVFETDVMAPILDTAQSVSGKKLGESEQIDVSLRIMADHARAMTCAISDGVTPSNEGRGYVLRRLIRRAVRRAFQLGVSEVIAARLVESVVESMGSAIPELLGKRDRIAAVAVREEEQFRHTLKAGLSILEEEIAMSRGGALAPAIAFKLHDTYGFPIDLTEEIASENGLSVDRNGFDSLMSEQRERARSVLKGSRKLDSNAESYREILETYGKTGFHAYDRAEEESVVVAIADVEGKPGEIEVFLESSPFYAESGGQVGDVGILSSGKGEADVLGTTYALPGLIRHTVKVNEGAIEPGDVVLARVDESRRNSVKRNHTGTHLLHWALRSVLGDHVHQQGSLVAPDRLRFDFSHFSQVGPDEIREVERLVNENVISNTAVHIFETSKEEALKSGAMAFFGDKYGDIVRVVEAGAHSVELCGGTHVSALGEIGPVKVISESSIGSGVRRIEAVSGAISLDYVQELEDRLSSVAKALKVSGTEVVDAAERLLARVKSVEDDLKVLRSKQVVEQARSILSAGFSTTDSGPGIVARVDGLGPDEMRQLAFELRSMSAPLGAGFVVIGGSPDGQRASLISVVVKGSGLKASQLIDRAAKAVGGGVGRGDEIAMAGGRKAEGLSEALSLVGSVDSTGA